MTTKTPITDALVVNWFAKRKEPSTVEEVMMHCRISLGRYMPSYRGMLKTADAYAADVDGDRAVVNGILAELAGKGIVTKVQDQTTMGHPTYVLNSETPEIALAPMNPLADVESALRAAYAKVGLKVLRGEVNSLLAKIDFGE